MKTITLKAKLQFVSGEPPRLIVSGRFYNGEIQVAANSHTDSVQLPGLDENRFRNGARIPITIGVEHENNAYASAAELAQLREANAELKARLAKWESVIADA